MDDASSIGAQAVPLAAGTLADPTYDPTAALLLAYCRHWLRYALNDRLAIQVPLAADAVPEDRAFAWNPEGTWMRDEVAPPALYIWQDGRSKLSANSTMTRSYVERTWSLLWVFGEVQIPNGMAARAGLVNAADAALHRAFFELSHSTFVHEAHPAGSSLRICLTGDPDDFNAEYIGGEVGMLSPIPGGSGRVGESVDGRIQRSFLALKGAIVTTERVGVATQTIEDDELANTTFDIRANTETLDPADLADFMSRSLT
jgi:hypothetical protein